jgi:ADP-ribose pyrophosphatase YjhB (NUDIX family)
MNLEPSSHFHHCPRCGQRRAEVSSASPFRCAACGFTYFFSAANATATFIRREDGRVLFIRRARDPAKGKLAPPGGFVDIGERAEDAARREIREEVGLEITALEFLGSFTNRYHYLDVTYPVLDLFFTASAANPAAARTLDDVESLCWLDPLREITPEAMAFPSMQAALALLQEKLRHPVTHNEPQRRTV